jgi:hypothetical protein
MKWIININMKSKNKNIQWRRNQSESGMHSLILPVCIKKNPTEHISYGFICSESVKPQLESYIAVS